MVKKKISTKLWGSIAVLVLIAANLGIGTAQATVSKQSRDKAAISAKLLLACDSGDTAQARKLLAEGADVNAAEQNGWTALMLAVRQENYATVSLLVHHGANIHARSTLYYDYAPIGVAAITGNVPIVALLLAHGADVNDRNDEETTPLILAIENGCNIPPRLCFTWLCS